MNTNRAQRELFNALTARANRPGMCKIDDTTTMYSPDGYRAFYIRDSEMMLDKAKFKEIPLLPDWVGRDEQDTKLKPSNIASYDGERLCRRYTNEQGAVYINPDFLKCFDNPELWGKGRLARVLVYERSVLVGLILPVRVKNDDELAAAELELM